MAAPMFFLLSKILDVALSPLAWAMVLLAWALLSRRRTRRARRRRRALVGLALGTLWLFSLEPVAELMWRGLEEAAPRTYAPGQVYDAVVMLGGVVEGSSASRGSLQLNDNVERLLTTYDLLRRGRARLAVISGGSILAGEDGPSEAAVVALQLEDWGIEPDRVVVELEARNTRENAVFVERIVRQRGLGRVLVVTSAFHMARALDCFRAVGLEVDALPVDYRTGTGPLSGSWILPRARALSHSAAALRELSGRFIYRVRGFGRGA